MRSPLPRSVPHRGRRVAHAREFGDLVAFLVSERASYITGASINFDGGMSAVV